MKPIALLNSLLFLLFLFASCNNSQTNTTNDLWKNTQEIKFTNEATHVKIPLSFKRSSRYRIKKDIAILEKDTNYLRLIENILNGFEFQDKEVDVFVDTTKQLRFLTFINMPRVDFDQTSGRMINQLITDNYKKIAASSFGININKLDSKMNSNSQLKMLKFKFEIINTVRQSKFYQTLYFLSSKYRNIVAIENSVDKDDIENYLWTIKEK